MVLDLSLERLKQWRTLNAQLTSVKKQEMQLRKEIAAVLLPENTSGTRNAIVSGAEVKATITERLSVSREDVLSIQDCLNDEEKEAILWKPSIRGTEYRKLPKDSILRTIVTLKRNAPTLSIVIPED